MGLTDWRWCFRHKTRIRNKQQILTPIETHIIYINTIKENKFNQTLMGFQNSPQTRAFDQTTHENGGLVLHHSMQHDYLHEWICESGNIISWFWCQSKCEIRAIKLNKCPIMNFKGLLWIGLLISRCFSTSCQWPFTTSRPWIDITCFWSIIFNWLSYL